MSLYQCLNRFLLVANEEKLPMDDVLLGGYSDKMPFQRI